MRSLAPIVFFAYNRPAHTSKTLEALSKAELAGESSLWIFIDGPKNNTTKENLEAIEEVKKIAHKKKWCGQVFIIESTINKGLFQSIVSGITEIVNKFGKIIVLEDDVVVSPGFLNYMNDALDFYEHTEKVMHISGFSRPSLSPVDINEPTYFFYHTSCWGWATWKRAWDKFVPDPLGVKKALAKKGKLKELNMDGTYEFFWGLKAIADGKFQSWNTIWHSVVFLNDGLSLHPTRSMVSNIGHDGSGTNCETDNHLAINNYLADKVTITQIPLRVHPGARIFYKKMHSFKFRLLFATKHYLRYIYNNKPKNVSRCITL